jgi:hypothetical protein
LEPRSVYFESIVQTQAEVELLYLRTCLETT